MNEAELENIENRWMAASAGPWHIDREEEFLRDGPAIMVTSAAAFERMREGKTKTLEHLLLRTFEDAKTYGVVKTKEEWADYLEHYFLGLDEETGRVRALDEVIYQNCERIYCMTPATKKARSRDVDAKIFNTRSGPINEQQGQPSLAVIPGDLDDGDRTFILRASNDMGNLLTEVRRARKREQELVAEVKDLVARCKTAENLVADATVMRGKLRRIAEQIIDGCSE